jgi:hypothetical protein
MEGRVQEEKLGRKLIIAKIVSLKFNLRTTEKWAKKWPNFGWFDSQNSQF